MQLTQSTLKLAEAIPAEAIPAISFIIPVAREGLSLVDRISDFKRELEEYGHFTSMELIMATDVNDPETLYAIRKITRNNHAKGYQLTTRIGKGGTIKNVAHLCSGKAIVLLDADIPVCAKEIHNAIGSILNGKSDMVIAQRLERNHSLSRRILSIAYNCLVRLFFRTKIRDHQAGFKVIDKNVFMNIVQNIRNDRLGFDTEMVVWAKKQEKCINVMPVKWRERRKKTNSNIVTMGALITMLLDLLILRLVTVGERRNVLTKLTVGKVINMQGEIVGDEYEATIESHNSPVINILRKIYFYLAFGK